MISFRYDNIDEARGEAEGVHSIRGWRGCMATRGEGAAAQLEIESEQ